MRTIAGGVIAIVLLGIYAWLIAAAAHIATCSGGACPLPGAFNGSMAQALSVTTGLVSALVVAELAVTRAGEAPAARLLATHAGPRAKSCLRWVVMTYLVVWLAAGLAAFVIGLERPDALPALTNVGQAWFGVAVAAAYAYLGIKPAS
ncbi:MAG TPA: hypothetical protein VFW60_02620 [Rhodanobacteraceae bacterium]|nr:hypothetical protein [Rhodanobacteraceae bacterium]